MNDPRFPILGPEIPLMLGREKIMQRMWSDLTKTTPSHLSVVGPRFIGKSVLLKALAERMNGEDSPYCAAILWDLGHQTPQSDDQFLKLLCKRLGEGILDANRDYGEHLLSVESDEYAEICEVMDALHSDGEKILMLWDGFDKPLSGGTLTRNLWDNLLDLCRKPSFRLVTSTRKELHQLIRDEKSVTSDFWGVFEGVVRVTPFDDADIESILATLTDLEFLRGAKTELINWSAGFPPLFLQLVNRVLEGNPRRAVNNEAVNQAALSATDDLSNLISALWEDCPEDAKDLYILLAGRGELIFAEVGREERACLIEKGFATQTGNKLVASCRMIEKHIEGKKPDAGSMARLFGTWEDYRSNIRSLLERRLKQIGIVDERLNRLVVRAIEDIPNYPDDCLNNLTSIEERAFDLIWQCEFGESKIIPQEIFDYWDQIDPQFRPIISLQGQTEKIVPGDRTLQCGILQILTGSRRNYDSKARYVTKNTYVLLNAIHSFRNRNQHADGEEMHVGIAVAAIMSCIELLACLERELQ